MGDWGGGVGVWEYEVAGGKRGEEDGIESGIAAGAKLVGMVGIDGGSVPTKRGERCIDNEDVYSAYGGGSTGRGTTRPDEGGMVHTGAADGEAAVCAGVAIAGGGE